jgi:hypothetical protein
MSEICEPFGRLHRLIDMRIHDPVNRAYRTTFGEYASKLEALQRLLESKGSDNGRLEAAMQDVETARQAYHSAREVLASELGIKSSCTAAAASR